MIESAGSGRFRNRRRTPLSAFSVTVRSPNLRRAQLSFGATFTGEWGFTVALGVVAFDHGGAAAVGLVAFVRTAPAALVAPLGTALADRLR